MDTNKGYKQSQNSYNTKNSSSYLFNTEDHLNTLRSSCMTGAKTFGFNPNANFNFSEVTLLKNASNVSRFLPQTKFVEDINGVNTQRKLVPLIETPRRGGSSEEVQSKSK
jgi:hypothetical protein